MKKNFLFLLLFSMCVSLSFADGLKFCSYVGYSSDDWTYPGDLGISTTASRDIICIAMANCRIWLR